MTLGLSLGLAVGSAERRDPAGSCAGNERVEVCAFWVRALPPTVDTTAGYVTLRSASPDGDVLLAARSPDFAAVEIHESSVRDGLVEMVPHPALAIGPEAEVRFEPGGLHLMMMGAQRRLVDGTRVALTLEFRGAGTIEISGRVRESGPVGSSGS